MLDTSLEGADQGAVLKCSNHLNWLLFMDSYFLVLSMHRSMLERRPKSRKAREKEKVVQRKNRKAVKDTETFLPFNHQDEWLYFFPLYLNKTVLVF